MAVGGDDKNLFASEMTYCLPDLSTVIINIFLLHSGISPICYYLWLRQTDAPLSPGSLPLSPTLPHQVSNQSLVVLKILGGGEREAGVWMQGHVSHVDASMKDKGHVGGVPTMQGLPGSFTCGASAGRQWGSLICGYQ